MSKKIVITHAEDDAEVFPLLSLVIGLKKAYPQHQIIWIGEQYLAPLVRYNKRVKRFLDIRREFTMDTLQIVFGSEICVNTSRSPAAKQFASNVGAQITIGFDKSGPVNRQAEFFENVMSGKIPTNKTSLQLYYDLAGLSWRGEGYGLSYYPKTKQAKECGYVLSGTNVPENCSKINLSNNALKQLDTLNAYSEIFTDDLFVAYASIALRKRCFFVDKLPYRMEFFGKGSFKELG